MNGDLGFAKHAPDEEDAMKELNFRPSRIKAVVLALFCAVAAIGTWLMLGQEPLFSAITLGGLTGKTGIACLIFTILTPFAFLKAAIRPASLTIDQDGVRETSVFGKFQCRWSEVLGIEMLHQHGVAYVQIRTANQTRQLMPGYGPGARKLVELLQQYRKDSSSMASPTN